MIYRDAARKLMALGCVGIARGGGGSHRKWFNPALNLTAVLPDHKGNDLKLETLRAAVKQLGLNWQNFLNA